MEMIVKSNYIKRMSLFFIALIPNRELRDKINTIKKDFSERFGSSKALKVYPHITLKAPFKCSDNGRKELLNWFSEIFIQQKPFLIHLKDFGAFHNKNNPVVFVNPVKNNELIKMQRELMVSFNSLFPAYIHQVDLNFKPHMTVAYRDLTPANFSLAWQEYKNKPFNEIFEVNSIYLPEHDTKKWNLIATYNLSRSS
jgi:2'-5' RNA ligase